MNYVVKKKEEEKIHLALLRESICQQTVQELDVMHVINQTNPVI